MVTAKGFDNLTEQRSGLILYKINRATNCLGYNETLEYVRAGGGLEMEQL